MLRSPFRLAVSGVLAASLAACSGGNGGVVPPSHRATNGKLTAATFTIKWTNPTATAAMRRKDMISPAAQSITVSINGKSVATANRGTSPTQDIELDAPVGIDQFLFNVYDQPAGQGHLLGSAQVNQQIIDGAANTISAAIQAICTLTNVSISDVNPLGYGATTRTGIYAPTLQTLVLMGQFGTTLAIEPEDVDGDVIIAGTGGTAPFSITSGASAYAIDGSHIRLFPSGGMSPTSLPGTLTVAAAGCPTTTVAIKNSPAIYAGSDYEVVVLDWFGDVAYSVAPQPGDKIVGFDYATQRMIAYNSATGQVSAYDPTLVTRTPLYTIYTNSVVSWSNFLHQIFAAHWNGTASTVFSYTGTAYQNVPTTYNQQITALAASTEGSNAFADFGTLLVSFNLATLSQLNSDGTGGVDALATNDASNFLYAFHTSAPYISRYSEALGVPLSSDLGFVAPAVFGATDTDAGNIYGLEANNIVEAATPLQATLPGFNVGPTGSYPTGLVVVSTRQ